MGIICANCGSSNVLTHIETDEIKISLVELGVTFVQVPVRTCQDCLFTYCDSEAEDIKDKAVWTELEKMGIERKVDNDKLVSGQTYRIEIDDCCVAGEFISKFIGYSTSEGMAEFANGVTLARPSGIGGWWAEKL